MIEKHFVIATAGHVDHGKSALVKALTGTDPDRLPEEKAREITIDLGFAHLDLTPNRASGDTQTSHLSVSIIDVPGHEDFVRNMIAGLGSIDLGLLVVAADDAWMPQTEEHLQILGYLGVERLLVAINKADTGMPQRTADQVRQQLRDTPFANSPIVLTSARMGDGISQLKDALALLLQAAKPQRDTGKTRLLMDRAFNMPGIGIVVTGTLTGGTISAGQQAYLQPGNHRTRVRSAQSHRSTLATAQPGMRVGINLAEIPKGVSVDELRRGWVLTTAEYNATTVVDVLVEKSGRLPSSDPAARPLKSGTQVYVHHGTGRVRALLVLAGEQSLHVGQHAIGQLRLASPILAFVGDRFVVRDQSEQHTLAGGVILDAFGTTKSFRGPAQQQSLGTRATNPTDPLNCARSELERDGVVEISMLLRNSNFSESEVRAAVDELARRGHAIVTGEIAADVDAWTALRNRAIALIERVHTEQPQLTGLEISDLRAAFPDLSRHVDALIADLCESGFVRRGASIARQSHRPSLPAGLELSAKQILTTLREKPLDPPGRNQLAPDANYQQALHYLIAQGDAVEIGPDLVLSGEAFVQAKDIIVQLISRTGAATVSELREALHTSRRVAVPLLERLDRDRVTRRVGDRRVVIEQQPATPAS